MRFSGIHIGLFRTAIREQLGLKLVSERGPVDVLVVDTASELVPN
jgi:uncharacterized protein (TIGR03435 family)